MNNLKVKNITSDSGNKVANQFMLTCSNGDTYFQSYDSIIVKIGGLSVEEARNNPHIKEWKQADITYLDKRYWKYSPTTSKYRAIFLGESTKETQSKIDSGEYKLVDLN